jgi:sec-independent protein translocase protein TatC
MLSPNLSLFLKFFDPFKLVCIVMNQYLDSLIELRSRLLNTVLVFLGLFVLAFWYSAPLLHWYLYPLLRHLPNHHSLIATQITSPLLAPLTIAFYMALLCVMPYSLYQIWRFVAPALYPREQKRFFQIMLISLSLFILGLLFCYCLILPAMFQWIIHAVPKDVAFVPDIHSATQFITGMMIIFGISFQIPLICTTLVQTQLIRHTQLVRLRPYMIVGAFTLGMLLTPPDVLSQIILAIPLWMLYESGVWLSRSLR